MRPYKNANGNSGVVEFSIGDKYIEVRFASSAKIYRYSYKSAGIDKVERMKYLAIQGSGLNAFINKYARNDYEK